MMQNNVFDFERPIVELESKLGDMQRIAEENGVELSAAASELERKIEDLKVNIYSSKSLATCPDVASP